MSLVRLRGRFGRLLSESRRRIQNFGRAPELLGRFRIPYPTVLAGCAFLMMIGADLAVPEFSAFWIAHPMATALVSMGVFAVFTAWLVDWLLGRREKSVRSGVTANAVRLGADLAWGAISQRALAWPNLRNSQVLVEALGEVRKYQQYVAQMAITPNPGSEFYKLLAKHDSLCIALDEYVATEPPNQEAKRAERAKLLDLQAEIDRGSWPYYKSVAPDYWKNSERFTPPFSEPPPWFVYMPERPVRRSPDPRWPTQNQEGRQPHFGLERSPLSSWPMMAGEDEFEF